MNKNQHMIIDETIRKIKEKQTLKFVYVEGKDICVKSKDRCFVTNDTFDFFEIETIEHKENEVFLVFRLLI